MIYTGEINTRGDIQSIDILFLTKSHNLLEPIKTGGTMQLIGDLPDLGEYGSRTIRLKIEVEIEEEESGY